MSGWPPWTADDSQDLDRQVRLLRKAEKRERSPGALAKAQADSAKRGNTGKTKEGK
jgi:hypothetical protein